MKENYPLDYPDPSAAKVWARVIKSFVLVAPRGLPLAGFFWNARLQCKTDHGDRGVQIDRDGWAKLRNLLDVLNEETKVMEMARKHTRHKHTREKVMEVARNSMDKWGNLRFELQGCGHELEIRAPRRYSDASPHPLPSSKRAREDPVVEKCIICMDTAMCIANSPCGHLVYCQDCFDSARVLARAQAIDFNSSCPRCRKSVVTTLHVFF